MLHKKIDDSTLQKMFNWIVSMKVREERNELRFKVLLEMANEGKDLDDPPLTLEILDRNIGYDEARVNERIVQYFDLPSSL